MANTRPRYGGTLRVQTLALPDLDRSPLIAETLVRINQTGEAEAWLARTWQHDSESRRWRFTLRAKVMMHDGKPLTNEIVASILNAELKLTCTPLAQSMLVIQGEGPIPDLLDRLASPAAAIVLKSADNLPIGTGPFRVTKVDAGKSATLIANETYWGGRPFVDSVEFAVAPSKPIAASFQTNVADIWQLPVAIGRRLIPEHMHVWSSAPRHLIVLAMPDVQPAVREALALSIDRQAIVDVLTQHRGEIAFGLLPNWLTGYEFLFTSHPDPARARQLIGGAKPPILTISAATGDSLARLIGDRVAVNARDAGITVQSSPQLTANIRVLRLALPSNNAAQALTEFANALGALRPARLNTPDELYQAEKALLEDHSIVPILYLPDLYGYGPRVRDWNTAQRTRDGQLHLENLWVAP